MTSGGSFLQLGAPSDNSSAKGKIGIEHAARSREKSHAGGVIRGKMAASSRGTVGYWMPALSGNTEKRCPSGSVSTVTKACPWGESVRNSRTGGLLVMSA